MAVVVKWVDRYSENNWITVYPTRAEFEEKRKILTTFEPYIIHECKEEGEE